VDFRGLLLREARKGKRKGRGKEKRGRDPMLSRYTPTTTF